MSRSIHMHRGFPPPTDERKTTSQIHRIAEPILDAFQIEYTRTHSAGNVSYLILNHRDEDGPGAEHRRITIPVKSAETFSLATRNDSATSPVAWAAGVEVALACRQAGLIRNYCDPAHWDRITDEETPTAIRDGLRTLSLTAGKPELLTPEVDPLGKRTAQKLLSLLGPGYLVLLFGSRQRGDNADYSDVDLLIQLTEDSDQQFNHAHSIVEQIASECIQLVDDDPPYFDVLIVDHWGAKVWQRAHHRLNPDGGTVSVFALPGTAIPDEDRMPVEFPNGEKPNPAGALGYLLTDSATTLGAGTCIVQFKELDRPLCKR